MLRIVFNLCHREGTLPFYVEGDRRADREDSWDGEGAALTLASVSWQARGRRRRLGHARAGKLARKEAENNEGNSAPVHSACRGRIERTFEPCERLGMPSLVDRKRHIVRSLARRVATAAIGTAWGAAARVGHRDLRRASSGNVCSGDHNAKRVRYRVGCIRLRRSVPIHYCVPVKVAAGDRQCEIRTTVKLAGRHDCRNDRNNAGLCHLVRAPVPAAKDC